MAYESVVIPATGSGGTANPSVAVDTVAGQQIQIIKLDGGGDGASIPITAGQQTMAASLPVVIASNQTAVPVSGTVSVSGTVTTSGTVTANIGTTYGLALDASVTGLQVAQGSTTSGQKGDLTMGA